MVTPELQKYITQSRASGMSNEQIKQALVSQGGWSEADVAQALSGGYIPSSPVNYSSPTATKSGNGKIVFGVIVLLLVFGAGTYFVLLKNPSNNSLVINDLKDSDGTTPDTTDNLSITETDPTPVAEVPPPTDTTPAPTSSTPPPAPTSTTPKPATPVAKTTPTITWSNPATITKGTALSGAQLNASTGVAGTFTYTPALGTILDIGTNQTLSVHFVPTDTAKYNIPSDKTVVITVKAAPTWHVVGTYSGEASGKTPWFSIQSSKWRAKWELEESSVTSSLFYLKTSAPGYTGHNGSAAPICNPGDKQFKTISGTRDCSQGGQWFIEVNGYDVSWEFTVEEYY
jgi:hypothetical protein